MALASFAFRTATEICFGRGQAGTAAARIRALGTNVLFVHGANAARADWLAADLAVSGCSVTRLAIAHEPDLATIEHAIATLREVHPDCVVSLGGGSVIDAGKAIAALLTATRPILDHLEVVGLGLPLDNDPLPFIAIPTTSGTGAEVTRNAVIGVPAHRRKVSLRDPRMLADLAIVDPALTDGCPASVTLESGLDAITQLIEPFLSSRANPFTDALCKDALPTALPALIRLASQDQPDDRDAMAWASLCGGLALANSGLGVIHGLAGPLGGLSDAPHGAICGLLLPLGLAANRRKVTDPAMLARFDLVLDIIGKAFGVSADAALDALSAWGRAQGLRQLSEMGVKRADLDAAAQAALESSSMKANPVPLDKADLMGILEAAF